MTQGCKHKSVGLAKLCGDLRTHYPTLHPYVNRESLVEIAGAFPVWGANGEELDRYNVTIVLPQDYPQELPIVREVAGRIPWEPEWHVHPSGVACIIIPDDRWRCFPEGADLIDYLRGPIHNFFFSQTYHAEKGVWPFGVWEHGAQGVLDYYHWLLDTVDDPTVCRFLSILAKSELKGHWECPCGSDKTIKKCCLTRIRELRSRIPPSAARDSFSRLDLKSNFYDGLRLRKRSTRKPRRRGFWGQSQMR